MRPAFASLALAAVFIAGCSSVAPSTDGLDGPTTTITVAAGSDDLTTLGVPFVDGQSVVATVGVAIYAVDDTASEVALTFSFADGLYTYDPDGPDTIIGFPFEGSVDVALPAGYNYGFETTGADVAETWLAYGLTTAYVDVTTTSVRLTLQTMIDGATLDTLAPTSAVDPGQSIDLYLAVSAPGGYAVPVADYDVFYAVVPEDGALGAVSKVGTRAVAAVSPTDDTFTVSATITGWRDVDGVATMNNATVTFEAPYAIASGLGFDVTAPVVSIDASTEPANAGTAYALSGTASDDTAIDRVHLYEGPVFIGSTDASDYIAGGVAPITFDNGTWTMDWTPAEARSHTLTALAIDTAGNEHRASATIEVGEPLPPTTLTFVNGEVGAATLNASESVILQGAATTGFDATFMSIYLYGGSTAGPVSTDGVVIADGMWTLDWTAPEVGPYQLEYIYNGSPSAYGWFDLNVQ